MPERPFQAPPIPPHAPDLATFSHAMAPASGHVGPELPPDNILEAFGLSPRLLAKKTALAIMGGVLIAGVLLGAMLFGGGSSGPATSSGLGGLVPNPDVRTQMGRCGVVSPSSPCLIYVVNHTQNDRLAESFIPDAMRLTGRTEYLIRMENPNYTKTRIPPGYIAQIKVPPQR